MKKTMLGFAACALILLSCSQNEEIEDYTKTANEEIKFAPYVNKTKASVVNLDAMKVEAYPGFRVFAVQHANVQTEDQTGYQGLPVFMDKLNVKFSNSLWSHSGKYYWPETDALSFFAMAPDNDKVGKITQDINITVPITIEDDVKDQIDILAASALNKKRETNASGQVDFQFKHILSRIGFKASMDISDNLKFKITGLKYSLMKVISSGKYKYVDGTIQKFSVEHDKTEYDLPILSDRIIGGTVGGEKVTSLTLNNEDSYLMILPQTVPNAGIKLEVTYNIAVAGDAYGDDKTAIIELPELTYDMGKAYTHTLKFSKSSTGGDDLLEVKFGVTGVEDWVDDETQPSDTNVPNPASSN
ncbi:MAG: fimbrillin family protein [Bacteroidales bacterium]